MCPDSGSEVLRRRCRAQAGYLLREVLEAHPAMKVVITREVEKFLFRPACRSARATTASSSSTRCRSRTALR